MSSDLDDRIRIKMDRIRVTPEQFARIREITQLHHEALVEAFLGGEALPEAASLALRELAIPRWPGAPVTEQAFHLGMMLASHPDPEADIDVEEFRERLARGRELPLSRVEAKSYAYARENAGLKCRGLGNTVAEGTESLIVQAEHEAKEEAERIVREEVAEAVKWREIVQRLKQRLGRATGDWSRDLQRIATTELNDATQQGIGATIAEDHGDEARVAKRPNLDACSACLEFYLDAKGRPRIFKLSEIRTESNFDKTTGKHRKRASWRATLEGIHPNCLCRTLYVPPGMGFNDARQLVPLSMIPKDVG